MLYDSRDFTGKSGGRRENVQLPLEALNYLNPASGRGDMKPPSVARHGAELGSIQQAESLLRRHLKPTTEFDTAREYGRWGRREETGATTPEGLETKTAPYKDYVYVSELAPVYSTPEKCQHYRAASATNETNLARDI